MCELAIWRLFHPHASTVAKQAHQRRCKPSLFYSVTTQSTDIHRFVDPASKVEIIGTVGPRRHVGLVLSRFLLKSSFASCRNSQCIIGSYTRRVAKGPPGSHVLVLYGVHTRRRLRFQVVFAGLIHTLGAHAPPPRRQQERFELLPVAVSRPAHPDATWYDG